MLDHPHYILSALDSMDLWSPEDAEAYVERFQAAWGGYDAASLRRALHAGSDLDRLFAVYALGRTQSSEARTELLPLLESPRPLERWASALVLGELREERALPTLWRMLLEFLPPDAEYQVSEHYRAWRPMIPFLLGAWGIPRSVPPLRAGVQAALHVELAVNPTDKLYESDVYYWSLYEDAIVYALGRLGGVGALAGIAGGETPIMRYPGATDYLPPQTHLEQWRVQLVMGALHGRYALSGNWTFAGTPGLLDEVIGLLEHDFGIRAEACAPVLQRYEAEMGFYISQLQQWEHTRAEWVNAGA